MSKSSSLYKRHRFPPAIIQHVVWLYHRFNLSNRDIEDLMAERGIAVSYESIRLWCIKFGPKYARRLRRRHQGYGDTIFGGQLTRMARLWMCIYNAAGTERQQSISSSGCYERVAVNPDESSPTS
jgi:hypothetical protein